MLLGISSIAMTSYPVAMIPAEESYSHLLDNPLHGTSRCRKRPARRKELPPAPLDCTDPGIEREQDSLTLD